MANENINMADIEVGFVNVCEKFGIRALNDYQRQAIWGRGRGRLKYRVPEMLSPAFWGETLENSEAYKTS